MKLAITGCNGRIGRRVVLAALKAGHVIIGIDCVPISDEPEFTHHANFTFLELDLRDYDNTLDALRGAEGVIHLAGCPNPGDRKVTTHNTNVILSWNVLRSAAELGIKRVAQASSVNVVALIFSQQPKFDYLPLDEDHPCLPDEPYGLSKLICELQADTIVRRYPFMRIASLRLSWSLPARERANQLQDPTRRRNDLWGYVHEDSGAEAFLLAVSNEDDKWLGHEAFFITADETTQNEYSAVLKEKFWTDVPLKGGCSLEGRKAFFDCSKAERLLGWVHRDPK